MFQHILLPTDGSELAERAVRKGIEFAKSMSARVTDFFAIPEYPYWEPPGAVTPERYCLHWTDAAQKILGFVADAAKLEGMLYETLYQSELSPTKASSASQKPMDATSFLWPLMAGAAWGRCCSGASPTKS
jgi:nucleotide-binding universal stress UspA family protein